MADDKNTSGIEAGKPKVADVHACLLVAEKALLDLSRASGLDEVERANAVDVALYALRRLAGYDLDAERLHRAWAVLDGSRGNAANPDSIAYRNVARLLHDAAAYFADDVVAMTFVRERLARFDKRLDTASDAIIAGALTRVRGGEALAGATKDVLVACGFDKFENGKLRFSENELTKRVWDALQGADVDDNP
jgi:hypothetical protein